MPKKLMDCVKKVKAKGSHKVNPWAVCVASTGLKAEHRGGNPRRTGKVSHGVYGGRGGSHK
jgi:hypothetical protein